MWQRGRTSLPSDRDSASAEAQEPHSIEQGSCLLVMVSVPNQELPLPQCCCARYPRTLGIENNGWGLPIAETFCDPLRSLAPTPSGGSVVSTRANSSQSIRWARNAPD